MSAHPSVQPGWQLPLVVPGLGPVCPAPMSRRLLARVIDGVLMLVVTALIIGVFVGVVALGVALGPDPAPPEVPGWFIALAVVFGVLIGAAPLVYEVTMIAKYGATVGKRAAGVRVILLADGRPPGAAAAFRRILPLFLGGLAGGIGSVLVAVSPYFDSSPARQGWHDKLARTMVISTRQERVTSGAGSFPETARQSAGPS